MESELDTNSQRLLPVSVLVLGWCCVECEWISGGVVDVLSVSTRPHFQKSPKWGRVEVVVG